MTLTEERADNRPAEGRVMRWYWTRDARIGFVAGMILATLIAAGAVIFASNVSIPGAGKPQTLTFQQDGESSGGPVVTPECTALLGQRITAVNVAVGCKINGESFDPKIARCKDGAAWYSIPYGATVIYGRGGGVWMQSDPGSYPNVVALNC